MVVIYKVMFPISHILNRPNSMPHLYLERFLRRTKSPRKRNSTKYMPFCPKLARWATFKPQYLYRKRSKGKYLLKFDLRITKPLQLLADKKNIVNC